MAKRLTDKDKKKIMADYAELGSYNATAKRNGVSVDTVRRTVLENPETQRIVNEKKEENTRTVFEYMDKKTDNLIALVDRYMDEFMKEEKIENTPLNQLSTVFGTVIDKFTMKDRIGMEREADNQRKIKELQSVFEVVNKDAEREAETSAGSETAENNDT